MKTINVITAAILAATLASPSVAQVAASFDGLVDDVLEGTNAAFFSAAINTAAIDGSVNIVAGSVVPAGELVIQQANTVSENAVGSFSLNTSVSDSLLSTSTIADGSFDFSDVNETVDRTMVTVEAVNQNFGDVSTVAAGAISDSTMNLTETGSLATAAVNSTGSLTGFTGDASNTAGANVGVIQAAINVADINGSISLSMANASGGATSIGSVAAGAINTGKITATFVGGSDAEAGVTAP